MKDYVAGMTDKYTLEQKPEKSSK
ncbi:hypothetical protein KKF55_00845 [Patescibacteria group bacterium]|nr:hypothetical protein [Patescibacteria group bacterium]